MLYIAEVSVPEEELTERMNNMRAWLDHRRVQPSSFRLCNDDGRQMLRVHFNSERDAEAFVAQFGGSLLRPFLAESAQA